MLLNYAMFLSLEGVHLPESLGQKKQVGEEEEQGREKEDGFLFFFFEMELHGWVKRVSEKWATEKKNGSFGEIDWLENTLKGHELRSWEAEIRGFMMAHLDSRPLFSVAVRGKKEGAGLGDSLERRKL